jgi:hypothetical protein
MLVASSSKWLNITAIIQDALPEIWDKMATDMRTLIKYGDQILL